MLDAQAHALISRKVALFALDGARAAWRAARRTPDEEHTCASFYWCVFAARALRKAAQVLPDDERWMIETAGRVDVAAREPKHRLVRLLLDRCARARAGVRARARARCAAAQRRATVATLRPPVRRAPLLLTCSLLPPGPPALFRGAARPTEVMRTSRTRTTAP